MINIVKKQVFNRYCLDITDGNSHADLVRILGYARCYLETDHRTQTVAYQELKKLIEDIQGTQS